jgi:hypothetical protein
MALNSTREQVINNVVTTLEGVESLSCVSRKRMTDLDELQSVPTTQLPYISVTGGLPEPIQKQSGRRFGNVEAVKSVLAVEIVCYALAPVDSDTVLSDLLDDVWAALYTDQTRGGIALGTELTPQVEPVFIQPYILFRVVCNVTYLHDTTHI